ncbi:MAG: hypothetical protein KatS3mg100_553 [Candidatus Parcubacteria bacterium]|nr:MAG: hypothetical protein KatS3mg100_553 [Candidatus Parcubacteria bacterium]
MPEVSKIQSTAAQWKTHGGIGCVDIGLWIRLTNPFGGLFLRSQRPKRDFVYPQQAIHRVFRVGKGG